MRARLLIVATSAAVVALGLAGCSGGDTVEPLTTTAPTSSTGSATPAPSASASADPAVAADLAKFDSANQGVASSGTIDDHRIVDALAAAGFDKAAMQITPDTTTIGRKVDSIEVSVLVGSTCLIGGFNGTTYSSQSAPALQGGKCLLGNTRAIDW
jgi:hypothetical protein